MPEKQKMRCWVLNLLWEIKRFILNEADYQKFAGDEHLAEYRGEIILYRYRQSIGNSLFIKQCIQHPIQPGTGHF